MLQVMPKGEYADVMERALYNGILSGMALDGKSFFYVNPLEVNPRPSTAYRRRSDEPDLPCLHTDTRPARHGPLPPSAHAPADAPDGGIIMNYTVLDICWRALFPIIRLRGRISF